jgi:hypothetical protein
VGLPASPVRKFFRKQTNAADVPGLDQLQRFRIDFQAFGIQVIAGTSYGRKQGLADHAGKISITNLTNRH